MYLLVKLNRNIMTETGIVLNVILRVVKGHVGVRAIIGKRGWNIVWCGRVV